MKNRKRKRFCCLAALIVSGSLLVSFAAQGALLYKTYLVRQVGGLDILCDPYVVQQDDWILKLFRQKGEISYRDFPEFLRIFKMINPHIRNLDIIRPGQHILIPLKKLPPGSMPGQAAGIITIPFVTIMSVSELLAENTTAYKVQKGDCVSKLIAQRFGAYGSQAYKDGIKLLKRVNPELSDINRIIAGQTIKIPEASVQNQSWYSSIFNSSGEIVAGIDTKPEAGGMDLIPFKSRENRAESQTPLEEAASILDAELFTKGIYHFPVKGQKDLELDLKRFPALELNNGQRVICAGSDELPEADQKIIESYWKNLKFAEIPAEADSGQILNAVLEAIGENNSKTSLSFSDRGVEVIIKPDRIIDKPSGSDQGTKPVCIFRHDAPGQKISDTILRYLLQHDIIIKELFPGGKKIKPRPEDEPAGDNENIITLNTSDHQSFVSDLVEALGYKYIPNVHITFPYAGVQVKAVSNFISINNEQPLLVDYGDLYGDSVDAIKKSGFRIVRILKKDSLEAASEKILEAIGIAYKKNPVFHALRKQGVHNIDLVIYGALINAETTAQVLIVGHPLDNQLVQFLTGKKIKLVLAGKQYD